MLFGELAELRGSTTELANAVECATIINLARILVGCLDHGCNPPLNPWFAALFTENNRSITGKCHLWQTIVQVFMNPATRLDPSQPGSALALRLAMPLSSVPQLSHPSEPAASIPSAPPSLTFERPPLPSG
jgi:hypothetical protein